MVPSFLFVCTLLMCGVLSFDLGHRLDLVDSALRAHGYPSTSRAYAKANNWMVEYYAKHAENDPRASLGARMAARTLLLETDELATAEAVDDFWTRLAGNTQRLVEQAALNNGTADLLTVSAVSLFAVHSFYAHSTWAAEHKRESCACLPLSTWLSESTKAGTGTPSTPPIPVATPAAPGTGTTGTAGTATGTATGTGTDAAATTTVEATTVTTVATGTTGTTSENGTTMARKRAVENVKADVVVTGPASLGGQCEEGAQNYNSYNRVGWQTAYSSAFLASYQWLDLIRLWARQVNPVFIDARMHLDVVVTPDLLLFADITRDLNWGRFLSSYLVDPKLDNNGEWKGRWSGDEFGEDIAALKYEQADTLFKIRLSYGNGTTLTDVANRLFEPVAGDATFTEPWFPDPIPLPAANDVQAVIVRTTAVTATPVYLKNVTKGDVPDFYARIYINDQEFVEATQRNFASPEPMWTSMAFVLGLDTLYGTNITYQLRNENGFGVPSSDKEVQFLDSATEAVFTVDLDTALLSGDLTGTHSSDATVTTVDGVDASVTLFVSVVPLRTCDGVQDQCFGGTSPEAFCAVERDLEPYPSFDAAPVSSALTLSVLFLSSILALI